MLMAKITLLETNPCELNKNVAYTNEEDQLEVGCRLEVVEIIPT